jgi:hypothetical protein
MLLRSRAQQALIVLRLRLESVRRRALPGWQLAEQSRLVVQVLQPLVRVQPLEQPAQVPRRVLRPVSVEL